MDATRRGFIKGVGLLLGGYFATKVMGHENQAAVENALSEFPKYSFDPQPMPNLGPGYRWVSKEKLERRIEQGYRFVGVRPIIFGGELVLMKKVSI